MAFIDEVKLHIRAGNGGDGVERWLHERGKEFSGPAGGNGGRGGDVYARAIRDIGILNNYKNIKELAAEHGGAGMKKSMHGKDGKDLVMHILKARPIKDQLRRHQVKRVSILISLLKWN